MTRSGTARGAGSDFLQLDPGAAPARGLTAWLTDALRAAIAEGRLPTGVRLPATRTLAGDVGVARGVVVEAYRRLADEGLVAGRAGVGTVVVPLATQATAPDRRGQVPDAEQSTPVRQRDGAAEAMRLPLRGSRRPDDVQIDLSPGVPDLSAFPRAAWLRAERAAMSELTATDLGYGDPRGSRRLRGELAGWLARNRAIRADAEDVVIVSGVAQALALLWQVLRARGTTAVAVEDPGSRGARDQLEHWGLRAVPVAVDADGVQTAALAASGVAAALLTPAHQFPTGVVLSPARRRELLEWAAAGGLVVEDDYDAEHRYDRAPVPALHASAPHRVAHTGSTSKTLAPGLRLGWLIPPPHLAADLVAAKHASDLGSPAVPQLALAHLLASGEYERQLRLVRVRHRRRRDAMLAALRTHLPHARVEGVAAGLHLLVTLPGMHDDTAVAAAARQAGIVVHPLSWHRRLDGPPGLVLGYAAYPPDRLQDAVRRLAAVVDAATRPERRRP
jgi:GntR family transcriptional regulator/MocR family aminotransferase